jgi:hypothetical protein
MEIIMAKPILKPNQTPDTEVNFQPSGPELVANGSFEQTNPALIINKFDVWTGYSGLPGWTNHHGSQLEVVNSGYAGIGPANGTHWLDTEASPGPIDISQVLHLGAGQAARMTFIVAAEDIAPAGLSTDPAERLDITFRGHLVKEITMKDFMGASGPSYNAFKTFTADIVGGGHDKLDIASHGAVGNVGFAIDSVSVKALAFPNV